MNAIQLAEILQSDDLDESILYYYGDRETSLAYQAGNMIRQQAQEIEQLKITNQDLKYQLIKQAGQEVLDGFKESE